MYNLSKARYNMIVRIISARIKMKLTKEILKKRIAVARTKTNQPLGIEVY